MVDRLRESTTIQRPGVERTEEIRDKPMPDEVPVTSQTAFSGSIRLELVMLSEDEKRIV